MAGWVPSLVGSALRLEDGTAYLKRQCRVLKCRACRVGFVQAGLPSHETLQKEVSPLVRSQESRPGIASPQPGNRHPRQILRLMCVLMGIALTTLIAAPGVSGQDSEKRLELEEVFRMEVPAGFIVTGGLLTDASRAIVWGPNGLLQIGGGTEAHLLVSGELVKIRGVKVVENDPATYQVMGSEGELFNVGSDGQISHVASCQIEGEVIQAVPWGDQWLIHQTPTDSRASEVLSWRPTLGATTPGKPIGSSNGAWEPPFRLISANGNAFIQEVGRPFGILGFDTHGPSPVMERLLKGETVLESLDAHGFSRGKTAALPMLGLDEWYLVQLSDLESDRRLMITLDSVFDPIRSVVVPAPMGFLAADQEHRQVLALVDTGVPELRFYRWRWSGIVGH